MPEFGRKQVNVESMFSDNIDIRGNKRKTLAKRPVVSWKIGEKRERLFERGRLAGN